MLQKTIIFKSKYNNLLLHPVPIKKVVPDWFKKLKKYWEQSYNLQNPTAKKCMPLLDSFTSGYAILNPVDIIFWSEIVDNEKRIQWRINENINLDDYPDINVGIQHHNLNQINDSFVQENEYIVPFKFLNPWVIQTPKNYSCLFLNPLNSGKDRRIRTLDAIVETDNYFSQVNFPFFLKKIEEEENFILKKGEPIALVFPFQRDNWKMKIQDLDVNEKANNHFSFFSSIVDNYKNNSWRRKNYD